jgi:uncharacterized FlgJ-related protein
MKKLPTLMLLVLPFGLMSTTKVIEPITVKKELNKETLYKEILAQRIEYPEVVFAQAMLESAELKSQLAKRNKNLFGMRVPKVRETVAVGKRYGHAVYQDWTESVKDYKLYQSYIFMKKGQLSYNSYLKHINKTYAEVGDYVKRLYRVMKEHKKFIEKIEEAEVLREAYASN